MTPPVFPPLMYGEAAEDPMQHACLRATQGCDAGLVAYALNPNDLQAALVFAPEVPLRQAAAMLPLCGVGFQNALGALAPPEVAVHLGWSGKLFVNGAQCGQFRVASSDPDPDGTPDWLVVSFSLPLWPQTDDPGMTPNQTTLYAEGCADVSAKDLLEAWARHTLGWIGRWEDDGAKALHDEWRGLAQGLGEDTRLGDLKGSFLGVDENFGMLLRADDTTHLIPLTTLLETP